MGRPAPVARLARLAALAAVLLTAAPAHAEPVSAVGSDGRDGTGGAARDVEQVRSTFDADAGSWTVTVRLHAPAAEAAWGMVNLSLTAPGADGTCGAAFATMRGSTRPASGGVSATAGNRDDGQQPDGSTGPSFASGTRTVSEDGRELTFAVAHPRLTGRVPACLGLTVTYENETLDAAGARFAVPAGYEPPPPAGGPGQAVRIRIASTRTLRLDRRGRATVFLRAFDMPLTGNARLRRGSRGPDLARAEWRASAGRVVRVRLRLTRAGRRYVRRRHDSVLRLTVGARPPAAAAVSARFAVRLVARR